jgi:large subunit ribosomal protein L15
MKLNELAPVPGARQARKRLGRGMGSGTGKTAGRGHKGQRARSGSATRTFEGGQMPIYRRLPKRGFKNPFRTEFAPVNLDRLQAAVDAGRIDAGKTVDLAALRAAGLVNKRLDGVRLLARGELRAALTIEIHSASKAAIAAVEKAGGKLVLDQPREADGREPQEPSQEPSKRSAAARAAGESGAADAEAGPGGDA